MMPVPSPILPLSPLDMPFQARVAAAGEGGDAALEKAAVQFESLFVAQMLKAMRQAADAFGDGKGDGEGAALLDHAYWAVADSIASQRAFGIADSLIAQMTPPAGSSTPDPHSPGATR